MQAHPPAPLESLSGLIERVTFFNEENGFAVLKVKAKGHRDEVTVVGSLPAVNAGEWLTAEGRWVRDREFGLQFRAELLKSAAPTTKEGIEKYLGGGMVKGIGPVYARKLVHKFGEKIFDIIENYSARLEEVEGIGPQRRRRIKGGLGRAEGRPRHHGVPPFAGSQHQPGRPHLQDLRGEGHRAGAGRSLHAGQGHPRHRVRHGGPDRPEDRHPA